MLRMCLILGFTSWNLSWGNTRKTTILIATVLDLLNATSLFKARRELSINCPFIFNRIEAAKTTPYGFIGPFPNYVRCTFNCNINKKLWVKVNAPVALRRYARDVLEPKGHFIRRFTTEYRLIFFYLLFPVTFKNYVSE